MSEQVEPSAAAAGEPGDDPSRRPERPADGLDAAEDPGEAEEDRASVLHGGRGVTEQSFTAMRVRKKEAGD